MGFFDGFKLGIRVTHLQNDSNDLINRYCDYFFIDKQMVSSANSFIKVCFLNDIPDMCVEEATIIKLATYYRIVVNNEIITNDVNLKSLIAGGIMKNWGDWNRKIRPKASSIIRELIGPDFLRDNMDNRMLNNFICNTPSF